MRINRLIFGNPLKTENMASERLSKVKALAVFASDVLSSVAYATESILIALGSLYCFAMPVAIAVITLLFVVIASYWQILKEYPNGGGAFAVANKNLGEVCGLIAASALLIAYSLTVAVSLSEGAHAIASAFPSASSHVVSICLGALAFLTIANLRGTQESATFLSIPTYCFILILLSMVVLGVFKQAPAEVIIEDRPIHLARSLMCLTLLRAFSLGCSALTGIESIASGVTAFKNPQYKNARTTLVIMGGILSTLFGGITYLAHKFNITPNNVETVLSQIAHYVFGDSTFYYLVQFMTACILFLAANTSFAGFPRLASVLAKEKYIPTRFANLGDRLAFSNGIVALSSVAFFLISMFKGNTHTLIPPYALCVFISFTLSQAGMMRHLIRERRKNWQIFAVISACGTLATFTTLMIIVESKFVHGAWVVMILIPLLFFSFRKINRQYAATNTELDLKRGGLSKLLRPISELQPKVVVPISRIHKGTLSALRFAKSLSHDVTAVVVNTGQEDDVDRLKLTWRAMSFDIPLVILDSPYRSVVNPFLDFLYEQDTRDPEKGKAIVVMPSFIPGKFWQNILHNQTATIFKTGLFYYKQESEQTRVIVEIPYQMKI